MLALTIATCIHVTVCMTTYKCGDQRISIYNVVDLALNKLRSDPALKNALF